MKNIYWLLFASLCCIANGSLAKPTTFYFNEQTYTDVPVKICVDSNFWFPYTFSFKGKPVGLHADITQQALHGLEMQAQYILQSWKHCLAAAMEGAVDAVLSVSYSPQRQQFLMFPDDAAKETVSKGRITQVAYYLITVKPDSAMKINKYEFDGDFTSLPQPLYIESDYSIVDTLQQQGVQVQQTKHSIDNFNSLLSSKHGATITLFETAQSLMQRKKYWNKFYIHKQAIFSKSYFLSFSRKSKVPKKVQRTVWKNIQKVRENRQLMSKLLDKYGLD